MSGFSNYPPGVTGFEREIVGADPMVRDVICPDCEFEGRIDGEEWGGCFEWLCPGCDREQETWLDEG